MVTQSDVARVCGLDVSSVNKILNEVRGPVFKKSTIKAVWQTARRLGYVPSATGKTAVRRLVVELLDKHRDDCDACRRAAAAIGYVPKDKRKETERV
jgi:hypothetical protein